MQKYQLFLSCGMILSGLCSSALGEGDVLPSADNSQSIALVMENIDQAKRENAEKLAADLVPHFASLKKLMLEFAETGQAYDLSDFIMNKNADYMQDWDSLKKAEENFRAILLQFKDGVAPTEKMKALQLEIESIQKQIEDLVFTDSSAPLSNSHGSDLAIQKEELLSKRDAAMHQLEILKTRIQAADAKSSEVSQSLKAAEGIKKGLEIRAQNPKGERKADYANRIAEGSKKIEELNTELKDMEQAISVLKENAQRTEGQILQHNQDLNTLEEQMNSLEVTDTPRHAGLVEKRLEKNRLEKKLKDLRLELRQERDAHAGNRVTKAQLNIARNELAKQIDDFLNKHLTQDKVADCHEKCSKILIEKAQNIAKGSGRCTIEPKAVSEVVE
ncbi:MAG: hypothetical protein Q8K36_03760, partial [Alphaproteobacteria bacterium]|nr:hypothetical protein [Alphaproteobacteria bacterium]